MNITVAIKSRRWADPGKTQEVIRFHHPDTPECCYEVSCPNTVAGEASAIRDLITLRKAAGLDYPGSQAPGAADTVTV